MTDREVTAEPDQEVNSRPVDAAARTRVRGSQASLSATLLLAVAAAPLLTSGVSVLGPSLRAELDLSRAQFGLFAVVIFSVAAALSVPLGRLSDLVSHRLGLALNFALAIAALIVLATADSAAGFIISAVIGGAALGISNPLTNRMVNVLGDPAHKGRLVATKQVGVQVAQVISALLYPVVAGLLTWRAGIGLGALLVASALCAILVWLLPRSLAPAGCPPGGPHTIDNEAYLPPKFGVLVLTVYAVLSGIIYQAAFLTLPLFAHEVFELTPGGAAMTGAVLGAAGLASRLAWGALADRWQNAASALIIVAALTFASLLLFLVATTYVAPWALWAGTILYGISGTAVTVVLTSTILLYFHPTRVGWVSGVVSLGTFAGFAAGPFLFGTLVDHTGYAVAWISLAACAALAGCIAATVRPHRPRRA